MKTRHMMVFGNTAVSQSLFRAAEHTACLAFESYKSCKYTCKCNVLALFSRQYIPLKLLSLFEMFISKIFLDCKVECLLFSLFSRSG